MKRYCVKCEPGRVEFLVVIRESESGYQVRVVRVKDGWEKVVEQSMPKALFETCLKTGYIYEVKEAATSVA